MVSNSPLPLGSKIKQVREALGYSQEQVARYAKIQRSKLSDLEMGKIEFDPKTLLAVRKFLEIENAPLLDHELELFMTRMEVWDDMLDTNRTEDSRKMANELSVILSLPYEYDMLFLYSVLDARTLIKENDVPAAKEKLDMSESLLDKASNKYMYLYHQTKGNLCLNSGDFRAALPYFQHALDIFDSTKSKDRLLAGIGTTYYYMGKIYHAIMAFERALEAYRGDKANSTGSHMKSSMALCYMHIGAYDKSKQLFDELLNHSRSVSDNITLKSQLIVRGGLSILVGDYVEALEFFDQAKKTTDFTDGYIGSSLVVVGAASEAKALRKLRKYDQSKEALSKAKPFAQGNELFTMYLDVQEKLIDLNDPECISYLEDVAIPFLRAQGGLNNFDAAAICKELVAYYTKKKAKTKAAAIKAIMCDIYEEVFMA
ncbi:MAG: tetratricopeptide repeat protein [Defluviitaleaceae bacterium]|nr:tetratricopeptide repeat protein [Defluviitaleaceae bacterium]